MADLEVEDTLREIRERVLAESANAGAELRPMIHVPEAFTPVGDNAARANGSVGDALARMQSNLATTERTWSRLPPLVSNRGGWVARLELWLKRQIKRATHWFTWEQVNFNSAVHHALGDARDSLAKAQSDIASLRASFERISSEADAEKQRNSETRAHLAAAESRFDSAFADLRRALDTRLEQLRAEQQAHANGLRAEQQAHADGLRAEQQAHADGLRAEQQASAEELRAGQQAFADELRAERDAQIHAREEAFQNEMRERVANLLEEQRVCFKQLSLEAGELATAQDRARRQVEARIEALEKSEER